MRVFTAIGVMTAGLGLLAAAGLTTLILIIATEELEQRRYRRVHA